MKKQTLNIMSNSGKCYREKIRQDKELVQYAGEVSGAAVLDRMIKKGGGNI